MASLLTIILAYLLSQFYRSFLAILAPELSRELGLSAADLGQISAVWFGTFALAQLPIGLMLDRFGTRWTMATLMLAAVAGALGLARATSAMDCLVSMGLIGLGCAPVYIGGIVLIGRTLPRERFALFSSALIGIGTLGNLVAAAPLAAAMAAFGWRATMMAIAGLTALSVVVVALVLRDPVRTAPTEGEEQGMLAGLAACIGNRTLWPIYPLILVSYSVVVSVRGLWVGPYFAQTFGLDALAIGHAVTAMVLAMIAAAFIYGPMDRWFS